MALLRSRTEFAHRPQNKDFTWPDATEDLFDSFINPESFHLPSNANGADQRKYSDDFISFFDTHVSSSGTSDNSLDVLSTIPDLDNAWRGQFSALSFEQQQEELLHEHFNRHLSIYSNPNGRAACSETDLIVLPTDEVEDEYTHAVTAPSTPRWRTKTQKPADASTPLTVRKRQSSASPSKVEKTQRRVTTMCRTSPHKASASGSQLTKRFQDAAAAGQLDVKVPRESYRMATPPTSTNMRSTSFDCDFDRADQAVRNPGLFVYDEFDHPLSPTSSHDYSRLQHDNAPLETPGVEGVPIQRNLQSRRHTRAEPHFQSSKSATSYASPPLDPHLSKFSLTPPATEPMSAALWSHTDDHRESFMLATTHKAEGGVWRFEPETGLLDPTHVTCRAPPAGAMVSHASSVVGLGISCKANGVQEVGFGRADLSLMHNASSNAARVGRHLSADFSPDALSLSPQQSMYPMSPLLEQHHGLNYAALSTPPRPQHAMPHFSPTPAQMQKRQTYNRPQHQRSHTVGTQIRSVPPSMLSQPAYADLSFGLPIPSPSPPPAALATPQKHTPPRRATPHSNAHHRQRSKSMHHTRRKSASATTSSTSSGGHQRQSSATNVGFVNFTPSDSKKILTGVAPSGSSKTKARREKEAAEKRRKLGEAAKRAVLEAGGDLEALEREVLALAGVGDD